MSALRPAALPREQAFWLASRGIQQLDLATRFASAAGAQGLRVLALKGISIADELYGGVQNRPMADIDFLIVNTHRFAAAADLARLLGLMEIGASDHALVFKESASGVVLELHISLTACPGLFPVSHDALWESREPVRSTTMFRLSNLDTLVHLALHTAFQHALAANDYHYDDFVRGLEAWDPPPASLLERARDWRALSALGLMVIASQRRRPDSRALAHLSLEAAPRCPARLVRWLDSQVGTPRATIPSMASVRHGLAPSKARYLRLTLFPKAIPGRALKTPRVWRRLLNLVEAGFSAPAGEPGNSR